jgi:hypothetical protein
MSRGLPEVVSLEVTSREEIELRREVLELRERKKFLLTVVRLLFTLVRLTGARLENVRITDAAERSRIVGAIERARKRIPLGVVLHKLGISKSRYSAIRGQGLASTIEPEREGCPARNPIHNNLSERELRREAVGRKNWLFVGSDEGGEVNATFVSLIASCQHLKINPFEYLRDLFCLLPSWNVTRVFELAPINWKDTSQREDVRRKLDTHPFRRVSLGLDP